MSKDLEGNDLLERVRARSIADAKKRPALVKKRRILRPLFLFSAWATITIGVIVSLTFISVFENTYASLGNIATSGITGTLTEDPTLEGSLDSIGMAWVPPFLSLYTIRWYIFFALVLLTGLVSTIFFLLTKRTSK